MATATKGQIDMAKVIRNQVAELRKAQTEYRKAMGTGDAAADDAARKSIAINGDITNLDRFAKRLETGFYS